MLELVLNEKNVFFLQKHHLEHPPFKKLVTFMINFKEI